jgi:hypothetical protein
LFKSHSAESATMGGNPRTGCKPSLNTLNSFLYVCVILGYELRASCLLGRHSTT